MNSSFILAIAALGGCQALFGEAVDANEDATRRAYGLVLDGDFPAAQIALADVEQTPETLLRRSLVALADDDPDGVRVHGAMSSLSEGLILAAQVHLIDLESDEAIGLLYEADGPVATEYLRRLEDADPAMPGTAEASALWAMRDRRSGCETASEVVPTLSDVDLRNEELLLWAGRAASIGMTALAQGLLDEIGAMPKGQNWRYQATQAMIWFGDGELDRASAHFAALEDQVSVGAVPRLGLADAIATAEQLGEEREFPCQDGWVGCIADDVRVLASGDPELPVDFFDLELRPGQDVFGSLSEYELSAEPEPAPVRRASAERAKVPRVPSLSTAPAPAVPQEQDAPDPKEQDAPDPVEAPAVEPPEVVEIVEIPAIVEEPEVVVVPEVEDEPAVADLEEVVEEPEVDEVEESDQVTCDNLIALEPPALMGRLTADQIACLEDRLTQPLKMTLLGKISRVLMANAYATGNVPMWAKLLKRHLDAYDQSDPDLCYRYALHLSRNLPGRAPGVIFWANRALENRTVWVGETYTSRVFTLYKVRAVAAQSLWKAASEQMKDEEEHRATTKVFAREWLEYARATSKDGTKALALCRSAAATESYCEP